MDDRKSSTKNTMSTPMTPTENDVELAGEEPTPQAMRRENEGPALQNNGWSWDTFKSDKRPRTQYAPASDGGGEVAVRLNVHLRGGQGCCGPAQMLRDVEDTRELPAELAELGVTWDEYHDIFLAQLDAIEQKHFPEGCCCGLSWCALGTCLCLGGSALTLCCAMPFFCKKGYEHKLSLVQPFDVDLREWQANANERLRHRKLFLKTQSRSWMVAHGEGATRYYSRWIAIALNEEEAARLSKEPHLFGFVMSAQQRGAEPPPCGDPCCCLGPNGDGCQHTPDETVCCVHPYEQVRSGVIAMTRRKGKSDRTKV
jgi:hypothetical protein